MITEKLEQLAEAIAIEEGFYVSEEQAKKRKMAWPTRAQRQANPGNIRQWKDAAGRPYPRNGGYVDFLAWARQRWPDAAPKSQERLALMEGWRILRVLIGQYAKGRYSGGRAPTLREMFRIYAPAEDSNDPDRYAEHVAARLRVAPDVSVKEIVG